jgi:hypothetical protein
MIETIEIISALVGLILAYIAIQGYRKSRENISCKDNSCGYDSMTSESPKNSLEQ